VDSLGALLPFVIILLAFWLLIIRPARMRTRQQTQLQNQLTPGQEIMTTAGLFATVAAVEDDAVVLEAAPGVRTRWAKAAVARIVTPKDAEPDEDSSGRGDDTDTENVNPTTGRAE
jgi:preprotein translocase subunit YajC